MLIPGDAPGRRQGDVFTCRCSLLASWLACERASERATYTSDPPVSERRLSRMENRGTVADAPMVLALVCKKGTSCRMHGRGSRRRQMTLLFRLDRYAKCTATCPDQSALREVRWKFRSWGLQEVSAHLLRVRFKEKKLIAWEKIWLNQPNVW